MNDSKNEQNLSDRRIDSKDKPKSWLTLQTNTNPNEDIIHKTYLCGSDRLCCTRAQHFSQSLII